MLLSSCGSTKLSEPSFSEYSNKVEYTSYFSELTKAQLTSPLITGTSEITSFSATQKISEGNSYELNLDNKIKSNGLKQTERSIQYDSQNNLMEIKNDNSREDYSLKGKDTYDSKSSLKSDVFYQSNNDNHSYIIDLISNVYSDEGEDENYSTELKLYAKTSSMSLINNDYVVASYPLLNEEERAKYSFYNDNNVFTYTYIEDEQEDVCDSAEKTKIIATKKTSTVIKSQISITSTLIKYLYSEVISSTTEFIKEGIYQYSSVVNKVKAGDKATEKEEDYTETVIEFKDVTLSRKDLSQFSLN